MVKPIIDTAKKENLYGFIINNGFIIPEYQRTYDWEKELINQLFDDITLSKESKRDLYLGVIVVLGNEGRKKLIVIDGQQRIITLLIILRCILDTNKLSKKDRKELNEKLSDLYFKTNEPKIKLNLQDTDKFFQEFILKYDENCLNNVDKRYTIIRRIIKAKEIIDLRLRDIRNINSIFKFIKEKISIVLIRTENEFSVYDIYESINSKKMELAVSDLTKNILLKKCKYESKEKYNEASNKINVLIKLFEDSPKETSNFLKTYWAAKYEIPRGRFYELYKKNKYFKDNDAIKLIDDLSIYGNKYIKIINPEPNHWNLNKSSQKELFETLKEINFLGLKTTYPLLLQLMVIEKDVSIISRLSKRILNLSFISLVLLKERPSILESLYSKFAQELFNRKITSTKLEKDLKKRCRDKFKKAKEILKNMPFMLDKKETKYILYKILNNNYKRSLNIFQISLENVNKDSIEHFLPQSYNKWINRIDQDINKNNLITKGIKNREDYKNKYCYLLGNLGLLSSGVNEKIKDEDLPIKKRKLKTTEKNNPLIKDFLNSKDWGSKQIESRTDKMIEEIEKILLF